MDVEWQRRGPLWTELWIGVIWQPRSVHKLSTFINYRAILSSMGTNNPYMDSLCKENIIVEVLTSNWACQVGMCQICRVLESHHV